MRILHFLYFRAVPIINVIEVQTQCVLHDLFLPPEYFWSRSRLLFNEENTFNLFDAIRYSFPIDLEHSLTMLATLFIHSCIAVGLVGAWYLLEERQKVRAKR